MAEIFFYIERNRIADIVDCGLKLSEWYDRELYCEGELKRYISAYLNPRDNPEKYHSNDQVCIKINVETRYCFVLDRKLYEIGTKNQKAMELYNKSMKPLENYIFGTYRHPECLISCTVIGDQISILNRRLDIPVLYENSEKLYIDNIIEYYRESQDNFFDILLYYYYSHLEQKGEVESIHDYDSRTVVFIGMGKEPVITKMP